MALRNNKYPISIFVLKSETLHLFIYFLVLQPLAVTQPIQISIPRSTKPFLLKGEVKTMTLQLLTSFKTRQAPNCIFKFQISFNFPPPPDGDNWCPMVRMNWFHQCFHRARDRCWQHESVGTGSVVMSQRGWRVDFIRKSAHFVLYLWSFRGLCETWFPCRQAQANH